MPHSPSSSYPPVSAFFFLARALISIASLTVCPHHLLHHPARATAFLHRYFTVLALPLTFPDSGTDEPPHPNPKILSPASFPHPKTQMFFLTSACATVVSHVVTGYGEDLSTTSECHHHRPPYYPLLLHLRPTSCSFPIGGSSIFGVVQWTPWTKPDRISALRPWLAKDGSQSR
jgi:hypothetical protein